MKWHMEEGFSFELNKKIRGISPTWNCQNQSWNFAMTSRLPIEQRGARSKWTYDTESIEYAYRATVMISFVLVSLQAIVLGTRFPWAIGKPHSAAKLILACEFVLAWCFNGDACLCVFVCFGADVTGASSGVHLAGNLCSQ
ncbi:hypothetical protein BC830DRAFT_1096923 [Chytriomyces sp. MP71]|nr:hypothetical protein BC830DRAFT_1096923 [Chytriomyces sp. MP71]